jgi:UDP-GlcNAc:undecaprenyl-phosphate GlcNAc-1-phosphate transferase
MNSPILAFGAIAVAAFVAAAVLARGAVALGPRLGFVAHPDTVNRHPRAVPLLGGAAILLASLPAVTYASFSAPDWVGLIPALAVLFWLGLAKDGGVRLRARHQLTAQLLAGLLLSLGGLTLRTGAGFWVDIAATSVLTVALVNGFNFLDVQDGLAATNAALAASGFAFILSAAGAYSEAAVAVSLGGASLGFLILNRAPARIFMGDAGSFVIGLILAALCACVLRRHASLPEWWGFLPVSVPLLELSVTILLRATAGRSPFRGDGVHLTTCLRKLGVPDAATLAGTAALGLAGSVAAAALALRGGL